MRKIILLILILSFLGPAIFAQSVGGGISFFFPESLLDENGSISKEDGLSTSLDLGNGISLPLGFTYIKASGLTAYADTDSDDFLDKLGNEVWYVADTFIPYVQAKMHFGINPVFIEVFGGIAGAWIVAPQAFDGAIARYYASQDGSADYYVFNELQSEFSFGFGYQVGAAVGFTVSQISISLEAGFTDIKSEVTVTSDNYYEGGTPSTGFEKTFTARLRGISLGINGSYAF